MAEKFRLVPLKTFLVLMLISTITWLVLMKYPMHSDDTGFMLIAKSFENIKSFGYSFYAHRTGLVLPLLLFNTILGYGLISYYACSYLFYATLIYGVSLIAQNTTAGRRVVPVAILFMISIGRINETASNVMTDIPTAAFNILSLGIFAQSISKAGRVKFPYLLLSAFLGFGGYLCKMTTSVFLVALPVYEMAVRRKVTGFIVYCGLFAIMLAGEALYCHLVHGNYLIRYELLSTLVGNQQNLAVLGSLWEYLFRVPLAFWNFPYSNSFKVVAILGLPGVMWAVWRKEWLLIAFGTGAMAVFAIYAYPVVSWDPLMPAVNFVSRHYLIPLILLAIGSAYLIVLFSTLAEKRWTFNSLYITTIIAAPIIVLLLVNSYLLSIEKLRITSSNKYYSAAMKFGPVLAKHPEILKSKVFTMSEKNFGLYPNFNHLNIIDAERFHRPNAPAYLLTPLSDYIFYADLYMAIGNFEVAEYYSSIIRDTPYRDIIFQDGDIIFARIEKWVSEKDIFFSYVSNIAGQKSGPDLELSLHHYLSAKLKNGVELTAKCRKEEKICHALIQICTVSEVPKGTYQIELQALITRSGAAGMKVEVELYDESGDGTVISSKVHASQSGEIGNTATHNHIHRVQEFRIHNDAPKFCVNMRPLTHGEPYIIEELKMFRFKE